MTLFEGFAVLATKNDFHERRRQKLLGQDEYARYEKRLGMYEASQKELLSETDLHPDAIQETSWLIASNRLEKLVLHYTAGDSLDQIAAQVAPVIEAFDKHNAIERRKPGHARTLEITQLEAYVYMLWLLTLCTLLGHRDLVPVVLSWVDKDPEFNRGRDGLFEFIVEKLIGSKYPVERVLLHADAYRALAKATVSPPEERPALVQAFLKDWYKHMDDCYWHGSHTDRGSASSFFGYWAFEAALVTYLWDIDDSSYRDHEFYPKDLVDYARKNFPYTGPVAASIETYHGRVEAGQPCPRAGYWFTPASPNSRRRFQQGEVMPDTKSSYGATIWQWDENQA
jgi:hypothetical protein